MCLIDILCNGQELFCKTDVKVKNACSIKEFFLLIYLSKPQSCTYYTSYKSYAEKSESDGEPTERTANRRQQRKIDTRV